jgi:4-aminobutyrate aminotransferase-like enzyme
MGTGVALEIMKMVHEQDYGAMVSAKGKKFLDGLRWLMGRHNEIGEVDGLGLALRLEVCQPEDRWTPNKAFLDKMLGIALAGDLEHGGKRMGLVLNVGGYYKNVITFAPSLEISESEIDLAIELLDQLFTRAKQ